MMGVFTSAGSLARAFGPISVGFVYKHWGPRVMMIFMLVFVFTGVLSLVLNYKRMYIQSAPADDGDNDNIDDDDYRDDDREHGINSSGHD